MVKEMVTKHAATMTTFKTWKGNHSPRVGNSTYIFACHLYDIVRLSLYEITWFIRYKWSHT